MRRLIDGIGGKFCFLGDSTAQVGCRLMEKDNKKVRDDVRREYNDTIRVSGASPRLGFMEFKHIRSLWPNSFANVILDTKHMWLAN